METCRDGLGAALLSPGEHVCIACTDSGSPCLFADIAELPRLEPRPFPLPLLGIPSADGVCNSIISCPNMRCFSDTDMLNMSKAKANQTPTQQQAHNTVCNTSTELNARYAQALTRLMLLLQAGGVGASKEGGVSHPLLGLSWSLSLSLSLYISLSLSLPPPPLSLSLSFSFSPLSLSLYIYIYMYMFWFFQNMGGGLNMRGMILGTVWQIGILQETIRILQEAIHFCDPRWVVFFTLNIGREFQGVST